MVRAILCILALACVFGSFVLNWRAAGLMFVGWWFDNMLKRLNERG